jgi:predicted ABC-type ATPase
VPPKFRLFAGPNGSGKTFLFEHLKRNGTIHTELYINADRVLRDLNKRGNFNFNAYRIKSSEAEFIKSVADSTLLPRVNDPFLLEKIHIKGGVLTLDIDRKELNAYHASFIATYLATRLFETNQSFCFETVMSHADKLQLFGLAKKNKYKSYLYFVFTENPELNIARVKLRAAGGLHDVDPQVVKDRYDRTFTLLPEALELADEAFIIDNSDVPTSLIEKRNHNVNIAPGQTLNTRQTMLLKAIIPNG